MIKKYIKNFKISGIELLIIKALLKLNNSNKFQRKKNEIILKYLFRNVYKNIKDSAKPAIYKDEKKIIFSLWWDGFDKAPDIVQKCVKSLTNIKGFEIVLLDKSNVFDYVKLSNNIKEKFDTGAISITHLSDIIRVNLLANYNCIWADATIFVTDIVENIDMYPIYSLKGENLVEYVSENKWTGFFMSSIGMQNVFEKAVTFFEEYWLRYDILIDYFLIDYVYELLYRTDITFKRCIDSIPEYYGTYFLSDQMLYSTDVQKCKKIIKENSIHKLSWKYPYKIQLGDII